MKIIQHTDSGMEGENEGPVSKERNVDTKSVHWLHLMQFTVVLT